MVGSHANSLLWCLAALLLLFANNALSQQLPEEVHDFIKLLVREQPPMLSEAQNFYGNAYETTDHDFIDNECWKIYRNIYSKSCVALFRSFIDAPEEVESPELGWIRERFLTVGGGYKLNSITRHEYDGEREDSSGIIRPIYLIEEVENVDEGGSEGYVYYHLDVTIGEYDFTLYYDPDRYLAGCGTEVFYIDGMGKIDYLVKEEGFGWLYSPTAEEKKIMEETLMEVKKKRGK